MRENKTRYAVLGLLSRRPQSGYDIRKQYESSAGNFWSESYGQIYPILRQLEADGLATHSVDRNEGRPDRKVYQITEAGREALREWLASPPETFRYRVEVLLKVMHGMEVGPATTIEHVERFKKEHEALLRQYGGITAQLNEQYRDAPNLQYSLLTVRCGERVSQAFVEWCDEAIARLRELAHEQQ
jgi:DNA-binding PadR family transcriptional regulator